MRLLMLLSLLLTCLGMLRAEDVLTNESIIKLVKAEISDGILVNMVNTQPARFNLGTNDLIALKNVGVSDAVIKAMMLKGTAGSTAQPAKSVKIENRTPVKLTTTKDLSSGKAKSGDMFDLVVEEDVVVNGIVAIPKGSRASGRVTEAQPKRLTGPNGLLGLSVDSVRISDQTLPLRGEFKKGGERISFPNRGKDVELPAGTVINAVVDGDKELTMSPGGGK